MSRRRISVFAVCLLPLVLTACGDSSVSRDPRTQAPLVRTATVQAPADISRAFTGVVAARIQSDLGFRVQGKVLERLVDTGQSVRQGQPLMRIDPVDLGLQAQAQQEAVVAASALARQAIDDEARYRNLVASGAVSASTYARFKAAADSAKAQLSAAQAQARVARNASGYAVLRADADGVVVETLAEPGQVVSAGQSVVRLARAGVREVVVYLPETLRPTVGSLAQASLYGSRLAVLPARLRLLSDAADPVTRTFEARYVLEGEMASAPLGATVTLQIPYGATSTQALQVPIGALYDPGSGAGVWVVSGKPLKVSWRTVQVLALHDDAVRVSGNLTAGEQVVSLGAHLLHDGDQVLLAEPVEIKVAGSQP